MITVFDLRLLFVRITMIPIRYVMCILCLFISFTTYLTRSNIGIAIVSMAAPPKRDNYSYPNLCRDPIQDASLDDDEESGGEVFDWSPELQGSVLGSFSWTYFLFQLPSGYIASRFGGRLPITFSFLITAIITGLGPMIAHTSVYLFITSRAFMAIFQAAIYPGMFVIMMHWMPIQERPIGMAMVEAGIHIGNIVMYFTSGFLIEKFTWTSMFYFPAIGSVVTLILATILLRNKPEDHFLCSHEEVNYIRKHGIAGKADSELTSPTSGDGESDCVDLVDNNNDSNKMKHYPIPWKKMLTNRVVIVLLLFKFSRYICSALITANMPGYFRNVLNEGIIHVGILYAVYTSIVFITIMISAKGSEVLIARGFITRTNCRKFASIFSGLMPSIALMMIPVMRCNSGAVKFFFFLCALGQGFQLISEGMIPAEISANFYAILFAIVNMSSIIPGFIAPLITGLVLGKLGGEWLAWDIVIHSFGAIGIVTFLFFFIFISAEKQDFDDVHDLQQRQTRSMSIVSAMSCSHRLPL